MFNIAWVSYSYGKADKRELKPDDFGDSDLVIVEHIEDSEADLHALIFEDPRRILISFRGTSTRKNWQTDLDVDRVHLEFALPSIVGDARVQEAANSSLSSIRVHSGFARAYTRISERVLSRVGELREERKRPVFLAGHSLGGALATLCSIDMIRIAEVDQIVVTTFGSPKVGNRQFAAFYDRLIFRHWRVVNAYDIVTKNPQLPGFEHVGKEVSRRRASTLS